MDYNWDVDPLTTGLIDKLRTGSEVEVKDYTRPIFRWTKAKARFFEPQKALDFAKYLYKISVAGDPAKGIPQNATIQPKYAFNILITMAQRRGSSVDAWSAYQAVLNFGFNADVFTLTALIDVLGRDEFNNISYQRACKIYDDMLDSTDVKPNVVTFVTMFRILGKRSENGESADAICKMTLKLLADARKLLNSGSTLGKGGVMDVTLHNAALAVCVRTLDLPTISSVLLDIKEHRTVLNTHSIRILAKLVVGFERDSSCGLELMSKLEEILKMNPELLHDFLGHVADLREKSEGPSSGGQNCEHQNTNTNVPVLANVNQRKPYVPCLGPGADESLRHSVIVHDLGKLTDRIKSSESLVEADFVTLVHQCRKRKWENQVEYILRHMIMLSHDGSIEKGISQQPHLRPSMLTYEAMFDAYFSMDAVSRAHCLYDELLQDDNFRGPCCSASFTLQMIKWDLQCSRAEHAVAAYWMMRNEGILPSRYILTGLLHGLGKNIRLAVAVLIDALCIAAAESDRHYDERDATLDCFSTSEQTSTSPTIAFVASLIVTLLESASVLGNSAGYDEMMECLETNDSEVSSSSSLLASCVKDLSMSENCDYIAALLMASTCCRGLLEAHHFVLDRQRTGALPPYPFLHSLVREAYGAMLAAENVASGPVKKITDSLPFAGFVRSGSVKVIDRRKKFIRRVQLMMKRNSSADNHATSDDVMDIYAAYFADHFPAEIDGDNHQDYLLRGYLRLCAGLSDFFAPGLERLSPIVTPWCMDASGLLLVHHLYVRHLFVKCKNQKQQLQTDLVTSLLHLKEELSLKGSTSATDEGMGNLIEASLRSINVLDLQTKHSGKIISYLLESMHNTGLNCLASYERIFDAFTEYTPNIEILKAFLKYFDLLNNERHNEVLMSTVITLLNDGRERPIKAAQFVRQYQLDQRLDDQVLFEKTLVDAFSRDDDCSNWSACIAYLSGDSVTAAEKRAIRIVRILFERAQVNDANNCGSSPSVNFGDLAVKLLCKYNLTNTISEYSSFLQSSESASGHIIQCHAVEEEYYVLPLSRENIVFVDDNTNVMHAKGILESQLRSAESVGHVMEVGIDVEWRPFSTGSCPTKCSILQIASHNYCFIFDLLALELHQNDALEHLIPWLLKNPTIKKLGFGMIGDFKRLRDSFPQSHYYDITTAINVFDFSTTYPSKSLSSVFQTACGLSLDKRMQRSDWERRPLSEDQIMYAATDAFALLLLSRQLA